MPHRPTLVSSRELDVLEIYQRRERSLEAPPAADDLRRLLGPGAVGLFRAVRGLLAKGLLQRERSPGGRRSLGLTASGRAVR